MSKMSELAIFMDDNLGESLTKEAIVAEVGEAGFNYFLHAEYIQPDGDKFRVMSV